MSAEPLDADAALIRAATTVADLYAEVSGSLGVSTQQARLLWVLVRRPSNMLGLGAILRLGKSTMTGVVARMEDAGLVTRSPDPDDRRHLIVAPTPRGTELAVRLELGLRERVHGLLTGLDDDDRDRLARILSRVIERAEELPPPE
jgi:DNA-binding MarR family transcriptional regulator